MDVFYSSNWVAFWAAFWTFGRHEIKLGDFFTQIPLSFRLMWPLNLHQVILLRKGKNNLSALILNTVWSSTHNVAFYAVRNIFACPKCTSLLSKVHQYDRCLRLVKNSPINVFQSESTKKIDVWQLWSNFWLFLSTLGYLNHYPSHTGHDQMFSTWIEGLGKNTSNVFPFQQF